MDISDEIHTRPPYKTRSASISAPGHSSMETIVNPPSGGGGGTPEGGTPGYRRRRQATRSQSARITAPRNVSRSCKVFFCNFCIITNTTFSQMINSSFCPIYSVL